jgi:DNA-binding SARP family transcriptional activator
MSTASASKASLAEIGERILAPLIAQSARNRQRGDVLRAEIQALIDRHPGPKPMTAQQIRAALSRENPPSVRRIQKHLKLLRAPSSVGRG